MTNMTQIDSKVENKRLHAWLVLSMRYDEEKEPSNDCYMWKWPDMRVEKVKATMFKTRLSEVVTAPQTWMQFDMTSWELLDLSLFSISEAVVLESV